jgi:hypothetical protein
MLERLRMCVASSDYEDRLEALERHAGVNGGGVRGRVRPVGHYGPKYDAVEDEGEELDDGRGALQ